MTKKYLQIMILSSFALIGWIGSDAMAAKETARDACYAKCIEKANTEWFGFATCIGQHLNGYVVCAHEFIDCTKACDRVGSRK